jgi:CRISPR-associated protein Cas1
LGPLGEAAETATLATRIDQLRGIEGAAAAKYFSLLSLAVPSELAFSGRNRRPPKDPVNALLSFGYVLAASSHGAPG